MSDEDRPHDPSQKRLDDARARGEIPRSADFTAAAAMAGFVIALLLQGADAMQSVATAALVGLSRPQDMVPWSLVWAMIGPVVPVVLIPAGAAVLALLAQRAVVFTPENLLPKLSRINPIAAAKHHFGVDGFMGFAKSLVKMALVAALLYTILRQEIGPIIGTTRATAPQSVLIMAEMVSRFLMVVAALWVVIGGADLFWQIRRHRHRLRMTLQEIKDEHREAEGDPHAKAERRARGQEIATNRMLRDVEKADVIIVNPTHYAVALIWQRHQQVPPVLLAKGTDEIAARIRERAAEFGVPIRRDPPTARAIHATVEIGQPIRPEHYRAVAAAIKFANAMRRRAGQKGRL